MVMEVGRLYLQPGSTQLSDDCSAPGTRFQHGALQRHMMQQHFDGLGRGFIEIGSMAKVVHSTVLAGNCGPDGVLRSTRAIAIEASAARCGVGLRCLPGSVFIAGSSRRTPLTPGAGATNDVVLHCCFSRRQQLAFETFESDIR